MTDGWSASAPLFSHTERILTLQLRELESNGIIKRTVYAEVPPRVEYKLTNIGQELVPIWNKLSNWGARHKKTTQKETT